jgi:hypothetical protein
MTPFATSYGLPVGASPIRSRPMPAVPSAIIRERAGILNPSSHTSVVVVVGVSLR